MGRFRAERGRDSFVHERGSFFTAAGTPGDSGRYRRRCRWDPHRRGDLWAIDDHPRNQMVDRRRGSRCPRPSGDTAVPSWASIPPAASPWVAIPDSIGPGIAKQAKERRKRKPKSTGVTMRPCRPIESRTLNQRVGGSSPPGGTRKAFRSNELRKASLLGFEDRKSGAMRVLFGRRKGETALAFVTAFPSGENRIRCDVFDGCLPWGCSGQILSPSRSF